MGVEFQTQAYKVFRGIPLRKKEEARPVHQKVAKAMDQYFVTINRAIVRIDQCFDSPKRKDDYATFESRNGLKKKLWQHLMRSRGVQQQAEQGQQHWDQMDGARQATTLARGIAEIREFRDLVHRMAGRRRC